MVDVSRLEDFKNRAVGVLGGFGSIDSLMEVWIKGLALRLHALCTQAREIVEELLINEFEALAIALVFGFTVGSEGVLEAVDDGDELFDDAGRGTLAGFAVFLFGTLAEIGEVRLMANEGLAHVVEFGSEAFSFGVLARCLLWGGLVFTSLGGGCFDFEFGVFHEGILTPV
jgi:hypothetical protein